MSRIISKSDVKKHNRNNDLWFIIHNDVYDVTKFLSEHPGGEDTLLDNAGKDATVPFEDVGHSDDARELLKKYKIGTLPPEEQDTGNAEGCCSPCPKPEESREKPWKLDGHSRSSKKHYRSSGLESREPCCNSIESCPRDPKPVCGKRPCPYEANSSCPRVPNPVCEKMPCPYGANSSCPRVPKPVCEKMPCPYEAYYRNYEPCSLTSKCAKIQSCPPVPKPVCEKMPCPYGANSSCPRVPKPVCEKMPCPYEANSRNYEPCPPISKCAKIQSCPGVRRPCVHAKEERACACDDVRANSRKCDGPIHRDSIYLPLGPGLSNPRAFCSQCASNASCPPVRKPEVSEEGPWICESNSRCSKKHSRPSPHEIETRGSSRNSRPRSNSESAITDVTSLHCNSIYVPLEPSVKRPRGDPCQPKPEPPPLPSYLKWYLLAAVLSAVVVGVVIKMRTETP